MSVRICLYQPILILRVLEVNMCENRPKREEAMSELIKEQETYNSVF